MAHSVVSQSLRTQRPLVPTPTPQSSVRSRVCRESSDISTNTYALCGWGWGDCVCGRGGGRIHWPSTAVQESKPQSETVGTGLDFQHAVSGYWQEGNRGWGLACCPSGAVLPTSPPPISVDHRSYFSFVALPACPRRWPLLPERGAVSVSFCPESQGCQLLTGKGTWICSWGLKNLLINKLALLPSPYPPRPGLFRELRLCSSCSELVSCPGAQTRGLGGPFIHAFAHPFTQTCPLIVSGTENLACYFLLPKSVLQAIAGA